MTPKPDHSRFIERQEAAMMKYHFLTNEIVNITGHQHPRVNGKPLKLGIHGLTVLLLLAERAKDSPGDFILTEDIVHALEKNRRLLGDLHMSWDTPTAGAVHTAVSDVRLALKKSRLPNIIESVTGKGYRLSIAPMNIVIHMPGAEKFAAFFSNGFGYGKDGAARDHRRQFPTP